MYFFKKNFIFNTFTINLLHRWRNVNYSCHDKINNCMSMKWCDYSFDNRIMSK